MNLLLQRKVLKYNGTIGELSIDGEHHCFTLEDFVREVPGKPVSEWKVKGDTAIPVGHYKVTLENSNRFGPDTITINSVEGFEAIRMHGGNTVADTEGCPLVGAWKDEDQMKVGSCAQALIPLKAAIKRFLEAKLPVWIEVRNP